MGEEWKRIPSLGRWSPFFLSFFQTFKSIPRIEKNEVERCSVFWNLNLYVLPSRRLSISLIEHLSSEKIDGENSFRGKCSFNGGKVGVDEVDRAIVCGRGEFWVAVLVGKATYRIVIDTYIYLEHVRLFAYWCVPGPIGIAQVAHKRSIERSVPDNEAVDSIRATRFIPDFSPPTCFHWFPSPCFRLIMTFGYTLWIYSWYIYIYIYFERFRLI